MKVFVVGGTGFVGVNLANRLRARGDEVTVMGHSPGRPRGLDPAVAVVVGDATVPGAWQQMIAGHEVVVNLAGAPIFTRWTDAAKETMRRSRVLTTRNVVDALPAGGGVTLVSTSAVGYYGFHGDEELDETAGPGDDFLARLCVAWEAEALRASERGARVVIARFGIVLGPGGGVLGLLTPIFRAFLGGPLGSGRQWFSWIHVDDLLGALLHLVGRQQCAGVYNLTAPGPVTNRQFARDLGRALHRPGFLPAPGFAVRLALGEFSEVILRGQRVLPRRLAAEGFPFSRPQLAAALADLAPPR